MFNLSEAHMIVLDAFLAFSDVPSLRQGSEDCSIKSAKRP